MASAPQVLAQNPRQKAYESGEGVKNVVREPGHGIFWPTRPDPVGAPNFHVKTCAFYRKKTTT